jgi:uncharacterized protein
MKKILLLILIALFTYTGFAQNFPAQPNTLVNDYTGTLSPEQITHLERKLVAFDDSTSIQVTVVLIKSLDGYEVNDYAYQLGRAWGVGGKEKNTGVVLLASLGDRKITIQTGYGMEGALPDAITKRIIENEIKPNFKQERYFEGLDAATNAIIAYTKGEYKNDKPIKGKGRGFPVGLVLLVIIVVIILGVSKGGGGNSGRSVIGGRGAADLVWWSMLAGMGRGGNSGWGGGSSGGFGGGGGFGGFGGGSFGGGGSSGSW